LLSLRGFHGKLIVDHANQEIRLRVNPAGESQHGSRKDPKSLSGGEKSFAQICLLLSVWEAMASPIRALDELFSLVCCASLIISDVFMDAVNRKMTMGLMVSSFLRVSIDVID